MVALVNDTTLSRFNIDTVERAIVFSVLSLQAAIANTPDNELLKEKVLSTIKPQGKSGINLNLDVYLPLDLAGYTKHGGVIIHALKTFNTEPIDLNNTLNLAVQPSEVTTPTMQAFPTGIANNFEFYLYYYAAILFASLDENRNEIIRIIPQLDNPNGAEVRLRIALPLDPEKWALNSSILNAVQRVTTDYVSWDENNLPPRTISLLTNDTILNNNVSLIN